MPNSIRPCMFLHFCHQCTCACVWTCVSILHTLASMIKVIKVRYVMQIYFYSFIKTKKNANKIALIIQIHKKREFEWKINKLYKLVTNTIKKQYFFFYTHTFSWVAQGYLFPKLNKPMQDNVLLRLRRPRSHHWKN